METTKTIESIAYERFANDDSMQPTIDQNISSDCDKR